MVEPKNVNDSTVPTSLSFTLRAPSFTSANLDALFDSWAGNILLQFFALEGISQADRAGLDKALQGENLE